MACFARLKSDIRCLKEVFPETHAVYRIKKACVDEIQSDFIVERDGKTKKYAITAHIIENYPNDPPVWCSEDDTIADLFESISGGSGAENNVRFVDSFSAFVDFSNVFVLFVCFRSFVKS